MNEQTMCEYEGCHKRATLEYNFSEYDPYDGVDSYSTERCDNHPLQDPRYTSTPIAQRPTPLGSATPIFYESLIPSGTVILQSAGLSNCCGWVISEDGRCLDCGEVAATTEVL